MKRNVEFYRQFYKDTAAKFNITEQEVEEICDSAVIYIKKQLREMTLLPIRIKYFGTFLLYSSGAKNLLKCAEKMVKTNTITQEQYEKKLVELEQFLKAKQDKYEFRRRNKTSASEP